MSSQNNDPSVPEQRVYMGKAILAVKNPPIHINVEREAQLLNVSNQLAKQKTAQTAKNEVGRTKDTGTMTEEKKISVGAKSGKKTVRSLNEKKADLKTSEKVEFKDPQTSKDKNAQDDEYNFKKPEDPKKLAQFEAKKINEEKMVEVVKRRCDEPLEHEQAKKMKIELPLELEEEEIHTEKDLTRITNFVQECQKKCQNNINQRVKIITRSVRGNRSTVIGNVLHVDADGNMILADVQLLWKRKTTREPAMKTVPVPSCLKRFIHDSGLIERHLGDGLWLCHRHMSRLLLRGEYIDHIEDVEPS